MWSGVLGRRCAVAARSPLDPRYVASGIASWCRSQRRCYRTPRSPKRSRPTPAQFDTKGTFYEARSRALQQQSRSQRTKKPSPPSPSKPRKKPSLGSEDATNRRVSRLEIKLAWADSGPASATAARNRNVRSEMELRRAQEFVNPFECLPTFRKRSECGPPPVTLDRRKGAVAIRPITFEDRTRSAPKSMEELIRRQRRRKRPIGLARQKSDKRDE